MRSMPMPPRQARQCVLSAVWAHIEAAAVVDEYVRRARGDDCQDACKVGAMKWTPTKKRCPRDTRWKLVSVLDMYGGRHVTVAQHSNGRWTLGMTVIAWAPLPRAYRGKP